MHPALVRGLQLPISGARDWSEPLPAGLQRQLAALCRKHCPAEGRMQSSAVAVGLSPDGQIARAFVGVSKYFSHPKIRPGPVFSATCAAVAAGFGEIVACAAYHRGRNTEGPAFSGTALEIIAELRAGIHRKGQTLENPRLIEVYDLTHRETTLLERLPVPTGGTIRRHLKPSVQLNTVVPVPRKFHRRLTPAHILEGKLPRGLLWDWAVPLIHTAYKNSHADGRTRPGRLRHACVGISASGSTGVIGVNIPCSEDELDTCSERCMARIAATAKIDALSTVIVSGEHYPKDGELKVCENCCGTLSHFIAPNIGNLLVIYLEENGRPRPPRIYWLSDLIPHAYICSEGKMTYQLPKTSHRGSVPEDWFI